MNDMMSSLSLSCGWRGSAGTGSFVQQVKNYLLPFSRAACRQCADEYLPPSRGGTRVPETAAHPRPVLRRVGLAFFCRRRPQEGPGSTVLVNRHQPEA